jgi:RNA polymerase sigma factor (sigma-70 family)
MRPTPDTEANQEEAALVAAVQGGDLQAFEPLVRRHLDAIHAFVALKLPVAHLVDELTHETFVVAFRCIEQFAPGTSFRAWLRAIAMNRIRAEIERQTRDERNRLAYSEQRILELAGRDPNPQKTIGVASIHYAFENAISHTVQVLSVSICAHPRWKHWPPECPAAEGGRGRPPSMTHATAGAVLAGGRSSVALRLSPHTLAASGSGFSRSQMPVASISG